MNPPSPPRYPAMALSLPRKPVEPGQRLESELWLRGGDHPVAVTEVRARLWARVHAFFDDDDGAPAVRLFDRAVTDRILLAADAQSVIPVRLRVPWSTPVTHCEGTRLNGLSVLLMVWATAAEPVGDVIVHLDVTPLPWQRRLLAACRDEGIRWDTTFAFSGSQHFEQYRTKGRPPVSMNWRTHSRWVSVELRRGDVRSIRLTPRQAARESWRELLFR